MKRSLPPFSAVRTFEAAARHLSFKAAAEELNISQSAVSHQIKSLEMYLGTPLFTRKVRAVALTDAGEDYFPRLTRALDDISTATGDVKATQDAETLTVSATSSYAAKWLIPRIPEFRAAHPGIDLRVNVDPPQIDCTGGDYDVAIRFCGGRWPGMQARRLMRAALFPVCSPGLLSSCHPLDTPDDLRHHTLLHYDHGKDWGKWLNAAGATAVDASQGIHFNDCNLMFEAAIMGQGVALGFGSLLLADFEADLLVRPFEAEVVPEAWYHFLCPPSKWDQLAVRAFRRWIFSATARQTDTIAADLVQTGSQRVIA